MDAANKLAVGTSVRAEITAMAHGGEGIARLEDGRVAFIRGGFPGDSVTVRVTELKKKFARGEVMEVHTPGRYRGTNRCPAAQRGAGCCDFASVAPEREAELKASVVDDQLSRLARGVVLPALDIVDLAPATGWRTRARFGVDSEGRAGTRKAQSNAVVTDVACSQLAPGVAEGIVGDGARRFAPGAEVIVVIDSEGNRHVVESRRAPRGHRVEKVTEVLEGTGNVVENVGGVRFEFPVTAFWQAHVAAPQAYSEAVSAWLSEAAEALTPRHRSAVGWDLYGGVGVFVPAIERSLAVLADVPADVTDPADTDPAPAAPTIVSVDYSAAATAATQPGLQGAQVEVMQSTVESAIPQLPAPDVVVLDPPRVGAGAEVVRGIASAKPQLVVHVGCDPATFARDVATWAEAGYSVDELTLFNAFPATHHCEVIALLRPQA